MKKTLLVFLTILLVFCCTSFAVFAEETSEPVTEPIAESVDAYAKLNDGLNRFYNVENLEITSICIVADEEPYMVIYGNLLNDGKDPTPWSKKFAITEAEYLSLFHFNESTIVYENGSNKAVELVVAEAILKIVESSKTNLDVELDFKPSEFTRNINYMGLGMIGIFVVVGVVIIFTYLLNKVTSKKEQ